MENQFGNQYQPSPEEVKKAEEMMTEEQKRNSEYRDGRIWAEDMKAQMTMTGEQTRQSKDRETEISSGNQEPAKEAISVLKKVFGEKVYMQGSEIISKESFREKMEKELSGMPPPCDERGYQLIDPEGLLKKHYLNLKKYIDEKGEIIDPEFFEEIKPATGDYKYFVDTQGLKEMSRETADEIYEFAKSLAYDSIYFENNRKIARMVLDKAFSAIKNSRIIGSGGRYGGDHMCNCNVSRDLGLIANKLGFPDLADKFSRSTHCPEGNNYSRGQSEPLDKYGPSFKGEEYSIDEIKEYIFSEIKNQIKRAEALQSKKEEIEQ